MGRIAAIVEWARETLEDGVEIVMVKIDPGGGRNTRAQHFADPGDDSRPLLSDFVATTDSAGSGAEHVTGYHDVKAPGMAGPGEKFTYARDAGGTLVAFIWQKSTGEIVIENAAGGAVVLEPGGDFVADNEITAQKGAATSVGLSTHLHLTAMGPSKPPTGGT